MAFFDQPIITLIITLVAGTIPAALWLLFWLQEDRLHPEPRRVLALVFFAGALTIPFVLFFENITLNFFGAVNLIVLILWATIEEIGKYFAAYYVAIKRKVCDEPIDIVIYMITAALGFAALENCLFLWKSIQAGNLYDSLAAGNLRFMGATLLHTLASGTFGITMAFAYYRNKLSRRKHFILGLVLAIALHTLFNFLIIKNTSDRLLAIFAAVWITIILLMLFIERIKAIVPSKQQQL